MAIVGLWNLFNLVIAGIALGVVCERKERRRAQRLPVNWRGVLTVDDAEVPVVIEDASLGGMKCARSAGRGSLATVRQCG